MRGHKYKTTVVEDGEEIELIIDFNDLDSLCSNVGMYGAEITKNMRECTNYKDNKGTEIYGGDSVKILSTGEVGVVKHGIATATADDNYHKGSGLGYYIQFEGFTEILGNTEYDWGEGTVSSNIEVVKGSNEK